MILHIEIYCLIKAEYLSQNNIYVTWVHSITVMCKLNFNITLMVNGIKASALWCLLWSRNLTPANDAMLICLNHLRKKICSFILILTTMFHNFYNYGWIFLYFIFFLIY